MTITPLAIYLLPACINKGDALINYWSEGLFFFALQHLLLPWRSLLRGEPPHGEVGAIKWRLLLPPAAYPGTSGCSHWFPFEFIEASWGEIHFSGEEVTMCWALVGRQTARGLIRANTSGNSGSRFFLSLQRLAFDLLINGGRWRWTWASHFTLCMSEILDR